MLLGRVTRRWRTWGAIAAATVFLIIVIPVKVATIGWMTPSTSFHQTQVWAQTSSPDSPDAFPVSPPSSEETNLENLDGYPVQLAGEELFVIRERVGSFSASDRATIMSERIQAIAADPSIPISDLQVQEQESSSNITLADQVIITITDIDARIAGQSRQSLTEDYRNRIQTAISQYREERSREHLFRGAVYSLISVVALTAILILLGIVFPWLYRRIERWQNTLIRPIRFQSLELISAQQTTRLLISGVKLIRLLLTLSVLYIFVPFILSFFPWTKQLGRMLFQQISSALLQIGQGFVNYLPNVFIVAIVVFVAVYAIRFVQPIFHEIAQGNLPIPGFYPEWANPTFNLLKVLVFSLALIVAVPYLPGSNSSAFQGISLFLGVLFSLGSTSAVANVVSGIILVYTRAFQVGDRVEIADAAGDIEEKTLLVTRIRTSKNVVITIPNAAVLGGNVVNFSASVREEKTPLLLHTTITLGYDVSWRKVYQVLIDAANATTHIMSNPVPFVLQTSLDDFYVSYELNAYTQEPKLIPHTYSQLYENIQDKCNEADIEILSPHYAAVRDGHHITIPAEYLSQTYAAPGFRVHPLSQILNHDSASSDTKSG